MGIEFEWKFCSTPEKNGAIRTQVTGEEAVYRMATTYYDTPGGDLSRRHFTLRRRMENDRSVCTLKTPAEGILAGGGRQLPLCEVEVELKSGSREAAALYALSLAARHGLEQEPKSKFARAKALAQSN